MAIVQTMCTSFKAEVAQALHNFTRTTGNVFKLALYVSTATLGADTTIYTSSGEVSSSGTNYTAGGLALTNITPLSANGTGYWSFDDLTFSNVTLTCAGALIYNSTNGNRAVCVLNFGQNITKSASNLIITFPAMGSTDSVLRIS